MSDHNGLLEEVFRDMFRVWQSKPRITRIVGGWVCRSSNGTQGFGNTPQGAYRRWKETPMPYLPASAQEARP